jgi:hypothetical protein
MPPHARAVLAGRGHRFAAYPRCSADPGPVERSEVMRHLGVGVALVAATCSCAGAEELRDASLACRAWARLSSR